MPRALVPTLARGYNPEGCNNIPCGGPDESKHIAHKKHAHDRRISKSGRVGSSQPPASLLRASNSSRGPRWCTCLAGCTTHHTRHIVVSRSSRTCLDRSVPASVWRYRQRTWYAWHAIWPGRTCLAKPISLASQLPKLAAHWRCSSLSATLLPSSLQGAMR
ncbi:hypothetical protein CALCODRAFT_229981 [Calocera cornea HHB12733]|uniref:Uncharacterized protein n=1 Tax=Calocera cornea HHB12733 TaxID=1353952 RepID=A0A165GYP4_9BASI|nr:hypothetical protein CALCODRAFT_229981 [Calocera cornea HHB12733]